MKINTRFIKSHPLLALIPVFTLRRLISRAALDEYPKGTVIYRSGQACDAVYLVISGRCEGRLDGRGTGTIYGPGEALGARELLHNEPYRSTVTISTHSVLLRLPAEELERIFADKPQVAGRFSQSLFGRRVREQLPVANRMARPRAGRIVSLASLSGWEGGRLEGALATAVHRLGRGTVLSVKVAPGTVDGFPLSDWPGIASRCNPMNGSFCLGLHVRETDAGFSEMKIALRGDAEEPGLIPALLSHLGLHFDYVLLQYAPGLPAATARECLVQSDVAYLFLRQSAGDLEAFRSLMQEMEVRQCSHIRPVLHLEPYGLTLEVNELLKPLGRPVHAYLREFPVEGGAMSPAFQLHLNRLAREIGQCRIGIALSSGGARGLSHIGVIQVLEENGIEVDVIAGSSMGAYVGAAWAHGYSGEMMERLSRELETPFGLLNLLEPVIPPRQGFMRSARVARRLRRSIGNAHFSDMLRPLRIVVTRLETMERVVLSSGEVAKAVEASIAIPGICVPVKIDGELYIDGGIADPLPVDVLAEMGIERIIAVNTIPTPEQMRLSVDANGGENGRTGIRAFLSRHCNYFARGNILDTMFRCTHGVQMQVAEMACRDADVALWTIDSDGKWHDFTNPGRYIALGRKVAEAQLSELKRLTKGEPYESRPSPKKSVAVAA